MRSVTSMLPSGSQAMPHGVSSPSATTSSLNVSSWLFTSMPSIGAGGFAVARVTARLGVLLADEDHQRADLLFAQRRLERRHRRRRPAVADGLRQAGVIAAERPRVVQQRRRLPAIERRPMTARAELARRPSPRRADRRRPAPSAAAPSAEPGVCVVGAGCRVVGGCGAGVCARSDRVNASIPHSETQTRHERRSSG